jgi:hypothetical protein
MAFKLDFDKMRDPEFKAKMKAEREEEERKLEDQSRKQKEAVDLLEANESSLTNKERSFFYSVCFRVRGIGYITEPQEKWLFDIARRFKPGDPE